MEGLFMNTIKMGKDKYFTGKGSDAEHVMGQKGDDVINGVHGNDILEGNRGADKLNGGHGDDVLFSGVGGTEAAPDKLTGGEGNDTFAIRVTNGGYNQITDFQIGADKLDLFVSRADFALKHLGVEEGSRKEERLAKKEADNLEKFTEKNKYFGQDVDGLGEPIKFESSEEFIDATLTSKTDVEIDDQGNLIITFFDKTTIKLDGVGDQLKALNINVDEHQAEDIIDILNGDVTVFSGSVSDYVFQDRNVKDTVADRDGVVRVENGSKVLFEEGVYTLKTGHNAYDKLVAEDGVDTILAGYHGHDDLIGGSGNDLLFGDNGEGFYYKGGNDNLNGGGGDDTLHGGGGDDNLDGGEGVDTAVFGGSYTEYHFQNRLTVKDTVNGRDGVDQLKNVEKITFSEGTYTLVTGHNAYDKLVAEDDVDSMLIGTHGHDDLYGGSGNDVLFGDNGVGFTYQGGNDNLYAGVGDDVLHGGAGNDNLDGGEGVDTAVFSGSFKEYHFQNRLTVTDTVEGRDGKDQLKDVEKATFSEGTYTLVTGHNAYDNLKAEDGVDSMLIGTHGHDDLTGGTGDDVLFGDNGVGFTYQGGDDTLDGGAGSDYIHAGSGDDTIYADQKAPAHLAINAESDIIDGAEGIDTLTYNDTYKNADSLNVYVVGDDSDTFDVETMLAGKVTSTDVVSNVEVLNGTRGNDIIDFSGLGHGMTYNDKSSGAGQDEVTGSDYNDIIKVMHGDDTVYASNGQDYVDGGHGQDKLVFDAATADIHVEANGPAYKQEYKVYDSSLVVNNDENIDNDIFTVVKNVESVYGNDGHHIDIL